MNHPRLPHPAAVILPRLRCSPLAATYCQGSASLIGCSTGSSGEERAFGYFQANMGLSLNYCFLSWKERRLVTRDICYQYTNNSKPIIEWKIIAAETKLWGSQEGLLQALAVAMLSRSLCQHFHYHPPGFSAAPKQHTGPRGPSMGSFLFRRVSDQLALIGFK